MSTSPMPMPSSRTSRRTSSFNLSTSILIGVSLALYFSAFVSRFSTMSSRYPCGNGTGRRSPASTISNCLGGAPCEAIDELKVFLGVVPRRRSEREDTDDPAGDSQRRDHEGNDAQSASEVSLFLARGARCEPLLIDRLYEHGASICDRICEG